MGIGGCEAKNQQPQNEISKPHETSWIKWNLQCKFKSVCIILVGLDHRCHLLNNNEVEDQENQLGKLHMCWSWNLSLATWHSLPIWLGKWILFIDFRNISISQFFFFCGLLHRWNSLFFLFFLWNKNEKENCKLWQWLLTRVTQFPVESHDLVGDPNHPTGQVPIATTPGSVSGHVAVW